MRSWNVIIFSVLALALFSCNNDRGREESSPEYMAGQLVLRGSLRNGEGLDLVLEKMEARELIPLDTVTCGKGGKFRIELLAENPGFYILRSGLSGYITLYLKPGEDVSLSGSYENPNEYLVSGSPGSEQLMILGREHRKAIEKLAEISRRNMELQHEADYARLKPGLDRKFDSLTSSFRDYSRTFIRQNQESPVILVALYNMFGQGLPVFDPEQDLQMYFKVDSMLWPEYKWMESVDLLHSQLEGLKAIGSEQRKGPAVGEFAPDFVSSDPDGNVKALSEFRGSYVLLGFWASWSPPSRMQNLYLVKARERFREAPFIILQVSLDDSEEEWKAAIKEGGLNWQHVSDLKRWNSPVADIYGLERIPFLMLLDPAGKILAVDIQGEELEEKLEILIKN